MSLVVQTNIGSLNAQRSLDSSRNELTKAMERLSSGKKINTAADDAAGFAIAERMTAQVRGLNMALKNANDALSLLSVIDHATGDVTTMLQRMRELAIQSLNDTNSQDDRLYLQNEVGSLIEEISRVATQTQFNGQNILDGTFLNKTIQVGAEAGQTISVSGFSVGPSYGLGNAAGFIQGGPWSATSNSFEVVTSAPTDAFQENDLVVLASAGGTDYSSARLVVSESVSTTGQTVVLDSGVGQIIRPDSVMFKVADFDESGNIVGLGGSRSIANLDVSTREGATSALELIDRALGRALSAKAQYGALQNRLNFTASNIMNIAEFTTAARSRIEDADFAAESARLAKAQVLQLTGTAMLAQANSSSQLVLSLIR